MQMLAACEQQSPEQPTQTIWGHIHRKCLQCLPNTLKAKLPSQQMYHNVAHLYIDDDDDDEFCCSQVM